LQISRFFQLQNKSKQKIGNEHLIEKRFRLIR
jgi:hypothetical protein